MLDFIKYPNRFLTRASEALGFYNKSISAMLLLTAGIAAFLFLGSSLRHGMFLSSAWDMGIFDQALYLISQGQVPFSSYMGFHVLGDHAALILYPLALLYKIHPDVHWLLATQAIALASGVIPTWQLARQAALSVSQSKWAVLTYVLYPVVLGANQFDFHPEVFAVPALLWAIWAARTQKIGWFCAAIAVVLSCKAVLSLTVAAMGIWLWRFEHRRKYGILALGMGLIWFVTSTQVIIPGFGGASAEIGRHLYRYGNLGNSFSEVALNAVTKPWLLIRHLISRGNVMYLIRLSLPVAWALTPQTIAPLISAIPCILLNMLSVSPAQKWMVVQYSLPVLPFVVVSAIAALKADRGWVTKKRLIVLCLVGGFVLFSGVRMSATSFQGMDNWRAKVEAVELVPPKVSVLATLYMASHLSQRSKVQVATIAFDAAAGLNLAEIPNYEAVLLDARHDSYLAPREFLDRVLQQVRSSDRFALKYQRDDVYLFLRKP